MNKNRHTALSMAEGLHKLRVSLYENGYKVTTDRWQGTEAPPEFLEILHADVMMPMYATPERCETLLRPETAEWAKEHFQERVSGTPLNPPPSHKRWLMKTDDYRMGEDKPFSHSYPERMWCDTGTDGVRFKWGNLGTAVDLLRRDPTTRQCYVPMWFPEDLQASLEGERVPCTFGWHLMVRGGQLHCAYHMRSCDVVRHLHNDFYFANMLVLWVIAESGLGVVPGFLHFSSSSLHCFTNDRYILGQIIEKGYSQ